MELRKQIVWVIPSKLKAQNPKQNFRDKNIFFEFQAAYHLISTRKLEFYAKSLKQLIIISSSFHQRLFLNSKVMGLVPKYYLLAGDTSHISFFFSYMR